MKKVILLVFLMPVMAYGQIVENFEPGNINNWVQSIDSHWKADTSGSISGRFSLHHVFDNPDAGTDQAGIRIDSLHPSEGLTTWSFTIRYGYDPSSSNNWSVFLMSDTDPSVIFNEGNTSGFAIGVNLTGYDDTLRLLKVRGSEVTTVADCRINWQTGIGISDAVRITTGRTPAGNWTVSVYRLPDELISTASGSDRELFPCEWIIVNYRYTSSKDRLLWFDDLSVDGIFHENNGEPATFARPAAGDVVISEIMADPEPAVSLPENEYLEITNRTDSSFNLKNWKLSSGDQDYIIPEIIIEPEGRLILCSSRDTSKYSRYGKSIGLKQFPSLTDNGKLLILYDNSGNLIHGVEYSSDWYGDELKSHGGWSLEMIDIGSPFLNKSNWTASESGTGGTPGMINSVTGINPDTEFSGDLLIFPDDSVNISVRSPEPLLNFLSMTDSILIDDNIPAEISLSDPLFRKFNVKLSVPLKRGKICNFITSGEIKDFAGNRLMKDKFYFGLTEPAGPGDILFNELLFNALPGDPDYLELYNCSDKIIDASRLEIVSVNDDSGDTSSICLISGERNCFLPGEYYAVTTDKERVLTRYFSSEPDNLFEIPSLPSMSDADGHLLLFSRELVKIDEVSYSEKMHSTLLSGYEGIALEKTDPGNNSNEARNWRSASESSGWGTPGAANSVYSEKPATSDIVNLSSSKITPDNDGFEDLLFLNFNLAGNSNVISVTVFDESGSYVRKIVENMSAGAEASLTWDGNADDGSPVCTGIYIVLITLFDDSGKTRNWKKVCTVIRR